MEHQECPYKGGLLRACNFEARYDELPNETAEAFIKQLKTISAKGADMRDAFTRRVYVRDVCTRCGKVIERC